MGLGSGFVFVYLFSFNVFHVFCVRLDHFIRMLHAFIVWGLVSSVPSQEIGWEERFQNDLFCVESDVKP